MTYELAKNYYMSGDEGKALELFEDLSSSTFGRPDRFTLDREKDTFKVLKDDKLVPKQFFGRIAKLPRKGVMGLVECTSEPSIREPLSVNFNSFNYDFPKRLDDVNFEIVFSFVGPHASNVRFR